MKSSYIIVLLFVLIYNLFISNGFSQNKDNEVDIVEIKTSFGDIIIWLYNETPLHKENFLKLAKDSFYNGTTFHRVIRNFVIQGGDPNTKDDNLANDGEGGPGYTVPAELKTGFKHTYGVVAAARMGDQVNPERRSSGSQFYIVMNKNGTPHLDGAYTVFGKVISGMDVAEKIAVQATDQLSKPLIPIEMQVKVVKMKIKDLENKYNFVP